MCSWQWLARGHGPWFHQHLALPRSPMWVTSGRLGKSWGAFLFIFMPLKAEHSPVSFGLCSISSMIHRSLSNLNLSTYWGIWAAGGELSPHNPPPSGGPSIFKRVTKQCCRPWRKGLKGSKSEGKSTGQGKGDLLCCLRDHSPISQLGSLMVWWSGGPTPWCPLSHWPLPGSRLWRQKLLLVLFH